MSDVEGSEPNVTEESSAGGPSAVAKRMSVAFIQDAVDAIEAVRGRSGLKSVDVVNRAVQLYAVLDEAWRNGSEVIIRPKKGKAQVLRMY